MTAAAIYLNPAVIIVAWGGLILLGSVLLDRLARREEDQQRPFDQETDLDD